MLKNCFIYRFWSKIKKTYTRKITFFASTDGFQSCLTACRQLKKGMKKQSRRKRLKSNSIIAKIMVQRCPRSPRSDPQGPPRLLKRRPKSMKNWCKLGLGLDLAIPAHILWFWGCPGIRFRSKTYAKEYHIFAGGETVRSAGISSTSSASSTT